MAKIALACYANPTYRQIADTVSYELPATNVHPARAVTTTNKLLQPGSGYYRSDAHGMKTGFTTQPGGASSPLPGRTAIRTGWSSWARTPRISSGRRQSCSTGPLPAPNCTPPRQSPRPNPRSTG